MSENEPSELDLERAMVFLENHGSTTYPPEQWERWRYTVAHYAPDWLTEVDPDECFTVLDFSLSKVEPPEGYTIAKSYAAGEKACPWCGDGTGEESRRAECKLCEGDGLLYWGEECQVVVFKPAWVAGAGQPGCLYDYGPTRHTSQKEAIDSLVEALCDDLGGATIARIRRDLRANGIHYFQGRVRRHIGHAYCEVSNDEAKR